MKVAPAARGTGRAVHAGAGGHPARASSTPPSSRPRSTRTPSAGDRRRRRGGVRQQRDPAVPGREGRRFLNGAPAARRAPRRLSWLMFIASGIGSVLRAVVHYPHRGARTEGIRAEPYDYEAHRHWKLIDDRLATRQWLAGDALLDRRQGVLGLGALVPFVLGCRPRRPGSSTRTSSGCSTRSARGGRAGGREAAHRARVQDRERRRGPARDVPAERAAEEEA